MKKVSILSLIAFVAIVISSCGSSNNVVSNNGISKRKYNKGFFFKRNSNLKTADAKVKDADFKEDKAVAKAEKVEARKAKKAQKVNLNETTLAGADVKIDESNNVQSNMVVTEYVPETQQLLNDDLDGVEWSVTENNTSATGESMEQMRTSNRANNSNEKSNDNGAAAVDGMTILLVILAIIIPPLAVFLFEGVTTRFWIDLILALVGIGLGVGLGGLAYLAALASVIYALLIVLNVI